MPCVRPAAAPDSADAASREIRYNYSTNWRPVARRLASRKRYRCAALLGTGAEDGTDPVAQPLSHALRHRLRRAVPLPIHRHLFALHPGPGGPPLSEFVFVKAATASFESFPPLRRREPAIHRATYDFKGDTQPGQRLRSARSLPCKRASNTLRPLHAASGKAPARPQ